MANNCTILHEAMKYCNKKCYTKDKYFLNLDLLSLAYKPGAGNQSSFKPLSVAFLLVKRLIKIVHLYFKLDTYLKNAISKMSLKY